MPAKKKKPKHKPGTIVTLKNGAKCKVLPSGKFKFIKGASKRPSKGGGVSSGGGLRSYG